MKDLEKSKAKIKREIEIMKELKHPNVVQLYDTEESGHYIAMVMEYCQGGDLGKVIEHIKTMLCEYEIQSIACQIASGLKLLNEKQILHRDLKLQNVLATSCDFPIKIKLADFGLSKHVADVATTMCGTVPYMAPEQLKGEKYTAKADMWSFGVLLYALVTGSLPFKEKSPKTLLTEIYASAKYVPLTLEKAKVSKICIDFISSLLQINPKDRISDEKLYAHEFISTDPELYKKKHPGLIFTMEKKTKTAGSGSEPSTPTVFCPMSDISSSIGFSLIAVSRSNRNPIT